MNLELKEEEASLVFRVLKNRLKTLRNEVRHSKDSEDRRYLKHKERLLNEVLNRFPELDERAHMKGFLV